MGSSRVATAVTSHTTTVAATQEPMPRMLSPLVSSVARINAASVDTRPMPPRNADAYRLGGYQLWMGHHSWTERGTGERIVDIAVELLHELHTR